MVARHVVGHARGAPLEEVRDGRLDVVDGDEVDVVGGHRAAVHVHVDPSVWRHAFPPRGAFLELLEEFEDPVERERLADASVALPPHDDPRAVDREGDAGFTDEELGLALALLVRVVEGGRMLFLLVDHARLLAGDVRGGHVVELPHAEKLGELDHAPGALEVHREDAPRGVFAEVHVGRAVQHLRDALQKGMCGKLLRVDRGDVALDRRHAPQHLVADFRAPLKRAFVADDGLRPLLGREPARAAHQAHEATVAPRPCEGDDDGTPHQSGEACQQNALGRAGQISHGLFFSARNPFGLQIFAF